MEIDFTLRPDPTAAYRDLGAGSSVAILFLHGLTGSPVVWVPIARALASEGIDVSVPQLPGHGTSWQDMDATGWSEWLGAARAELGRLQVDHDRVIVAGLSMGGSLALALAAAESAPDEVVVVNPALYVDSPFAPLLPVLRHVVRTIPSIGGDIAHPDRSEYAYERTPVAPLASFHSALKILREDLWKIDCPVTAMISGEDNIVGPRTLRTLRSDLPRPPHIVALRRSRHVATLDFDAKTIAEAVLTRACAEAVGSSPSETGE
ncbi:MULTISPECIES: alpha/beta hydrolase [unclassified Brevibacterium]|uniref:alpha/beta hydrolase n=1 Tax=unclassified Brevibacterium TaxID=2614124 RepID=UPI00109226CE|nr:alpha/beta fold hydrolase [Brevibacterium sp. S22]TGD32238.1 alpha/beta fold hydrolase [Brevibacterium sp. S22]